MKGGLGGEGGGGVGGEGKSRAGKGGEKRCVEEEVNGGYGKGEQGCGNIETLILLRRDMAKDTRSDIVLD